MRPDLMRTSDVWRTPPQKLLLPPGEVHVWRAPLKHPRGGLQYLYKTLTSDERERAARFHFERDRRRFIAARGQLRKILGYYLSLEPGSLRFAYASYGKPYLTDECGGQWLRFNVSHAGELALYVISRCREVGVDIEEIKTDIEHQQIARYFFSEREVTALSSLPEHLQQRAFFLCWTRKEAYIKGIGEGLSLPLHSFDVSLAPEEPVALLAIRDKEREASRWTLRGLEPGTGYEAALVAEGHDWELRCWQCS